MSFNRKDAGFTIVELLIVLTVISVLSGFLFPIGNQLKKQAKILSIKTDAFRYQQAFEEYYEEYHRYPVWCPLNQWFNLSEYFQQFINTFYGEKTNDNPEGIYFCEFNAQELTSLNCSQIQFFLSESNATRTAISQVPPGTKIYGTKILFSIPEE